MAALERSFTTLLVLIFGSIFMVICEEKKTETIDWSNYDPLRSRMAPRRDNNIPEGPYVLSNDRLEEIRAERMYPFYDIGGPNNNGDFQKDISDVMPQINKQLNFLLPFFGFAYNYTWLSLHGFLGFSNAQLNPSYPLKFPNIQWPQEADPSFIGPFYSKCKVGKLKGTEVDEKKPGVYFRLERDLPARWDQAGVELRERLLWDIRESMVGTETFIPKHALISTWKNVTFNGGITSAQTTTNTFQTVIVTDEVRSYALFIYQHMDWTTHTGAGGDTSHGEGGTPAFVGFNAGNGTRAYEYNPYSQRTQIRDLPSVGNANGFPGRHIFRIDEKIMPGVCIRDLIGSDLPLVFAPESGNMLGGTLVNITGPCFTRGMRITCRFDTEDSEGTYIDQNRAACIMPRVYAEGYITLSISLDGGPFYWKGKFFIETPMTSPEMIWFQDEDYHQSDPGRVRIQWNYANLTLDTQAKVQISLWGIRERYIKPELVFIQTLEESISNIGKYTIMPQEFADIDNSDTRDTEAGFLMINLTNPAQQLGMQKSPQLWSKPIPLAWYFSSQWRRYEGSDWAQKRCDAWIERDRAFKNFAGEIPKCPCLLRQGTADRGSFAPDFSCDKDGNTDCFYHQGAQHCIRTGMPNHDGAGQQCCYDLNGYLMMSADNQWGGNPHRSHNLGVIPWNEANKIPSLSHWYNDVIPFYMCCYWQDEQGDGCETYRFERRASQDCVGYQPPGAAVVFGDPHIYTFDNLEYTFNGKGEFVLVRADTIKQKLDVQGRFEQVGPTYVNTAVRASMLTAVAAKDNRSAVVEVRRRPPEAQWRYRLDVIVNKQFVYFDRHPQKIQHFKGVTVYTPSYILNQSQVIIMFQSGAGVEVLENNGYMSARVYLPMTFVNQTRGLFGNYSFDMEDDFTLPNGEHGPSLDTNNLERIHKDFAMKWVLEDKIDVARGKTLFYHENGRSSNFYYDATFRPMFEKHPLLPENVTEPTELDVTTTCGESYQCIFDYTLTLNKDFALYSKYYQDQYVNIKNKGLERVISCGALPTPKNGRKSSFAFTPGTMVKFDCDPGYVLIGEKRRWCYADGDWNWAENGEAECIPEDEYNATQAGITSGIVLAVLIPIAVVAVIFIWSVRKRNKQQNEDIRESNIRRAPLEEVIEKKPSPRVETSRNADV